MIFSITYAVVYNGGINEKKSDIAGTPFLTAATTEMGFLSHGATKEHKAS